MERITDELAPGGRTVNGLRRDMYADSVALMRAARALAELPGVEAASLVMGTPANLGLLADAGLLTDDGRGARPGDLVVAVRGEGGAVAGALAAVDGLLAEPAAAAGEGDVAAEPAPRALVEVGGGVGGGSALALISTPGAYAGAEALKALRCGMHAFVFSDNVPVEQEVRIKEEAHRRGLLAMGPDCGTAVLDGVPLGFANVLRPGRVGLIGASGTGLQQVACLLDARGEGVRQVIGTGGRDLSAEVGGVTALDALELLDADAGCELIVLVSKPPAPAVAERVLARAGRCGKPVVACFLDGTKPYASGGLTVAGTLRDAVQAALDAVGGMPLSGFVRPGGSESASVPVGRYLRALYAGGTFAYEARQVLPEATTRAVGGPEVRFPARDVILDLGDDAYTAGRPHPMIDPTVRAAHLRAALADPDTAVIVLDVVLGHGAGADPAGPLAAELEAARVSGVSGVSGGGEWPPVVAFVVGTDADPQGRDEQRERLREAGALLAPNSTDAIEFAVELLPSGVRAGLPGAGGNGHLTATGGN